MHPIGLSIPLENIRNSLVFWCFLRVQKDNKVTKQVNNKSVFISIISYLWLLPLLTMRNKLKNKNEIDVRYTFQMNVWQFRRSEHATWDLTHFRPMFHLWINQVVGFYWQNVWKTPVEEWHFKERYRSSTMQGTLMEISRSPYLF